MHLFNSRQSWLVKKDVNLKKCWIDSRGGRERIWRLGKHCGENVPRDKLWDEIGFPLACYWSNGFFFLIHSPAVVLNVAGRGGAGGRGAPVLISLQPRLILLPRFPQTQLQLPKEQLRRFHEDDCQVGRNTLTDTQTGDTPSRNVLRMGQFLPFSLSVPLSPEAIDPFCRAFFPPSSH